MRDLPVIDIAGLRAGDGIEAAAVAIDAACRETGFFYVIGHGVPRELQTRVEELAREFFALPEGEKARLAMPNGGRAWRGWFPLEGELTSGVPDLKEGLYFGEELGPQDARVRAGLPLHGANQFPERPEMREAVLAYMDALTGVGHALLRGISLALGLDEQWFDRNLTAAPTVLFRIFRYPPLMHATEQWSVGEHTDYGLLTILAQDAVGGLEVRGPDGWVEAPPIPDAFVVNLGDMLERMTAGRYRSTPHRVRNTSGRERLSLPLFLDPAWDAEVLPVPSVRAAENRGAENRGAGYAEAEDEEARWDGVSVHDWSGTYGDYLLAKVGKVFPALLDDVIR